MAQITVASGETETVASGDTLAGGPLVLDGTLNLSGTLEAREASLSATANLGLGAGGELAGEKAVSGTAELGLRTRPPDTTVASGETLTVASGDTLVVDRLDLSGTLELSGTLAVESTGLQYPVLRGEKDITATANLGLGAGGELAGEKAVSGTAELGVVTTTFIEGVRPLYRTNRVQVDNSRRDEFKIDNTRRDDFSAVGTGDVDD